MSKIEVTNGTKKNSEQSSAGKSTDKKIKSLQDLLKKGLKAAYSMEKQLIEALPEMAKAADSEELQDAINEHLQQTKRQAERLEKIFSRLQIEKTEDKCAEMEALIEGGKKVIQEIESGPVRDSALIIGAQKIEHHEIALYGSLCELADVLGYSKIADILDRTLEEEETTDENLTSLAQSINDEAYEAAEEDNKEELEEANY